MGLDISFKQVGNKWILKLKGELDRHTLSSLQKELETLFENGHRKVVINCANLLVIVPEGLQMLVSETEKFSKGRGILGLISLRADLKEMAQGHRLLLFRDEQEALGVMD